MERVFIKLYFSFNFDFTRFFLRGLLDLYVYDQTSLTLLATDHRTSSHTYLMQLDIDAEKDDIKPVTNSEFAQVKDAHVLKLK